MKSRRNTNLTRITYYNEGKAVYDILLIKRNTGFIPIKKAQIVTKKDGNKILKGYHLNGKPVFIEYEDNIVYKINRSNLFFPDQEYAPLAYNKEYDLDVGKLYGYYGKHKLL